ncbi:hypothetical protein [Streptomyces sp. SP17KL33]|uniref:hypothetical protein n=1 Tax=Streptomyces sp. SP17KL33 TaxID=3002534 RepID=UPI002E7A3B44|nr:hypothetical protein [Streptomyces sp. SP17KL33]MEE1838134.1 hypothetical protein [Streptomyces sp. SP17KL33]
MTFLDPGLLTASTQTSEPTFIAAPWTDEQVANLNRHQSAGILHPFTCGRREHHPDNPGVMVAATDGWHCPADGCGYRQSWAFPAMTKPLPLTPPQQRIKDMLSAAADIPRPCLFHEDIHTQHGIDCIRSRTEWLAAHPHLRGQAARDAYAIEVEQRILDQLVRQHSPARRINPALSKTK